MYSQILLVMYIAVYNAVIRNFYLLFLKVVKQNGGRVLNRYDPHQCTHLLALHKRSGTFSRVSCPHLFLSKHYYLLSVMKYIMHFEL